MKKNIIGIIILIILAILCIINVSSSLYSKPNLPNDTIIIKPKIQDTIVNVNGKKSVFIGDSHTAADYGWQYQVCKKTGLVMLNTSVGGKQTYWMLQTAQSVLTENFDYCFIYGGANDMASNRPPMRSVKNIQKIVNICNQKGIKPVVLTGFDPITCVVIGNREAYKGYPQRYAKFQKLLMDSITNAKVIKTHCISRTDCGDFLCHMTSSGHKKMAMCVIKEMKFQIIK